MSRRFTSERTLENNASFGRVFTLNNFNCNPLSEVSIGGQCKLEPVNTGWNITTAGSRSNGSYECKIACSGKPYLASGEVRHLATCDSVKLELALHCATKN